MPKKMTIADKKRRIAELEQKSIENLRWMADYRAKNMMEFITTDPNPGFNPMQKQLLEAFLEGDYKVFTYSGANRIGKTFVLTKLLLSVLFGKFLWDGTDIRYLFPHGEHRKVRLVGQDWEKHIKTVLIPELKRSWPANRKLKTKKNNVG